MPRRHTHAPHKRYEHTAPCARKKPFNTEAEALQAIADATLHDIHLELKTYQCPYCNKWHLSSVIPRH